MTGLSPFCRERIELWGILICNNKVLLNELQMKKIVLMLVYKKKKKL